MMLPGFPKMMVGEVVKPTTWNPADKTSGIALSSGNLSAARAGAADSSFEQVRSTNAALVKNYCEITVTGANVTGCRIGAATAAYSITSYPGVDLGSIVWQNGGPIYYNNSGIASYSSWASGDILGIAIDPILSKIYFSKNGTWQGSANPSTNTGGITIPSGPWFPLAALSRPAQALAKFAAPFTYSIPSGFEAYP